MQVDGHAQDRTFSFHKLELVSVFGNSTPQLLLTPARRLRPEYSASAFMGSAER